MNKLNIKIVVVAFILWLIIFPGVVHAANRITKIEITKAPTKTTYKAGEKFDKAGMEVTATYEDGTTGVITDYKVANGEKLEGGQQQVLVHYTEDDHEIEAIQKIKVLKMTKLEVTKAPAKTTYKVGEKFDETGMVVTATYEDGSKQVITDYRILNGASLEVGQKKVTINYSDGDREIDTFQEIELLKRITKIEITKAPTKTTYKAGEKFDKAGMEVTATYEDGTTGVITDYKVANGEKLEGGQQQVLVHYTEDDREIEAIQKITVFKMTKLEVTKAPAKTTYKVGEKFDETGMVVTATYEDGSKQVITDYRILNGASLEVGQKNVTINYSDGDREVDTTQAITLKSETADGNLPNAGWNRIIGIIGIIVVVTVVCYIKVKKYKK